MPRPCAWTAFDVVGRVCNKVGAMRITVGAMLWDCRESSRARGDLAWGLETSLGFGFWDALGLREKVFEFRAHG